MVNTFDRYALQKAMEIKRAHGAEVTCVTMGPPPAMEVLVEALEWGADYGVLLTDKRLAASDTLATAYALHMVVRHLGDFDILLTGLQTTDGDTAQVGPQMAERLNIPQITYCEELSISGKTLTAKRVIEGGIQEVRTDMPLLITVANSATPLAPKGFSDVAMVKEFMRKSWKREKRLATVKLDQIGADAKRTGLVGSPTVVGKTWKIGEIGGSCKIFRGETLRRDVEQLVESLLNDETGVEGLLT